MIEVAILNSVIVFFAFLAGYYRSDHWLKFSFILIFLFLAFRYNYGNDYQAYLNLFYEVNKDSSLNIFDGYYREEPGWLLLCRIFKPLGFFAMVAFLSAFSCISYYVFIKKHLPHSYYWLAIFIYVFNPGFLLINMTQMRQFVALSIFLYAIDFIYKKDPIRYFLLILIASFFHSSALILLPVYLLFVKEFKIKSWGSIILLSIFFALFIFVGFISTYLSDFIIIYYPKYAIYEDVSKLNSGFGLVSIVVVFALIIFYASLQKGYNLILFKLSIISFYFIPLGFIVQLIGRVGSYPQSALLIVLPITFYEIKNNFVKGFIILVYIAITLLGFYGFFQSGPFSSPFSSYISIFSARKVY
jgi:transmembrane protein EpsG